MLATLVFLTACNAPSEAPAPAAPEVSQVETATGVSLYVEKYGDGPNVVIAPGRLFMANEFRALAAQDRTLILYDMRNRGASSRVEDGAQITIMEDVRDIEALRQHFGAERISLIGYSYLGLMTALYAADHPDRVERLVQIGPVPRRFDTEYRPEQRAGEESFSEEGRAAAAAWEEARAAYTAARDAGQPPPLSMAELCAINARSSAFRIVGNPANAARVPDPCRYENEWPDNFGRHLSFHFADIQQRDFPRERFTALTLPVLTVHGTLDRNAAYGAGREWAQTFPNGRLITVQGGAHQVWLDDPAVIGDIDAFLRGEWPARAEDLTP
jgi:pimeloyl-ACP methyl ester carboxylesterase